jgi:hypothetical protein
MYAKPMRFKEPQKKLHKIDSLVAPKLLTCDFACKDLREVKMTTWLKNM